jgi:hypothetical protein
VLRCELAQNPVGNTTVDAVSLAGDGDAVVKAFSIESGRYPDNVSISCAIGVDPAVGLWPVDARGRAFRPGPGRRFRAVSGRSLWRRSERCMKSEAIRSVLGAPIAAPCTLAATRLESIRLSRACLGPMAPAG